jgi:hypothetical protein
MSGVKLELKPTANKNKIWIQQDLDDIGCMRAQVLAAFGGVIVEWCTISIHSLFVVGCWKGNRASTIPVLSLILVVVTLSLGELNQEYWDHVAWKASCNYSRAIFNAPIPYWVCKVDPGGYSLMTEGDLKLGKLVQLTTNMSPHHQNQQSVNTVN